MRYNPLHKGKRLRAVRLLLVVMRINYRVNIMAAKFTKAVDRANSHFRYYQYRKNIGNSIPLLPVFKHWYKRFIFEYLDIGDGA